MHNIYTTSAQRRFNIAYMLYKCFVFAGMGPGLTKRGSSPKLRRDRHSAQPPDQGQRVAYPENTGHLHNAVAMLAQRLHRFPNIETTLSKCPVFAGSCGCQGRKQQIQDREPMLV